MYCIVGLGNPGAKYVKTRHNVGWILLDEIFKDVLWDHGKNEKAEYAKITISENQVELLKPQTFMNDSGASVAYVVKKHMLTNNQIVVMHDEVDLPLGTVKLSFDRGDAGHNGIKSITQHLGGNDYYRLRIGVAQTVAVEGETSRLIKPNVLGNFEEQEIEVIKKLSEKVKKGIEVFISEGYEKAATFLNSSL